jgi:hypothetical protein
MSFITSVAVNPSTEDEDEKMVCITNSKEININRNSNILFILKLKYILYYNSYVLFFGV